MRSQTLKIKKEKGLNLQNVKEMKSTARRKEEGADLRRDYVYEAASHT